jgi:flagellar hook-associated protein 3 FlgL
MRLSTAYAFARTQAEITTRQAQLVRTQDQLSTGLKVQKPSDDPFAAGQSERARSLQAHLEIDRRSVNFARSTLGSIEGALSNAGDTLQAVRERLIGAQNPVQSMSDRGSVAIELRQMRSELLGIANRADGGGAYLFGGQGSVVAPFEDGNPVTYRAQAGNQQTGTGLPAEMAIDGASTFTSIASGAGNVNIFQALDTAILALENSSIANAGLAAIVSPLIDQVDHGLNANLGMRAKVGERLRALDSHREFLDDSELNSKKYNAELTEVDLVKAISDFSSQKTNLDAVMKTYSQISNMSLFDYI